MNINEEIEKLNDIFQAYHVDPRLPKIFGSRDADALLKMYQSGMGYGLYDLIISASNGHRIKPEEENEVNTKVRELIDSIKEKLDSYPEYVSASKYKKRK